LKIPLLSILIIAAALVVWHYQSPTESQQTALTSSASVTKRIPAETAATYADLKSTAAPIFLAEDEEPYEIVHGIKVRKDRNCTVEVEHRFNPETGNSRKIFSCIPNSPPETDPYTTYDSEVLAGMAYGDAHAAEVLGVRLLRSPDPEVEYIGLEYLLRAVALSNDTRGIALAMNNRYNSLQSNGTMNLDNIKRLVTLSHVSNTVSPGTMSGPAYQKILRDFGVSDEEIRTLIRNGDEILEHMARVQSEVTGNTHIREALNDA
jgi:hypothetical protein